MKAVFTTGEAAWIARVSQQTIIRCTKSGHLKSGHVPGSTFRRISYEQLEAFLKDQGLRTDRLKLQAQYGVLFMGVTPQFRTALKRAHAKDTYFRFEACPTLPALTRYLLDFQPDTVVFQVGGRCSEVLDAVRKCRKEFHRVGVRFVGIASGKCNEDAMLRAGLHEVFVRPFDIELFAEALRTDAARRRNK